MKGWLSSYPTVEACFIQYTIRNLFRKNVCGCTILHTPFQFNLLWRRFPCQLLFEIKRRKMSKNGVRYNLKISLNVSHTSFPLSSRFYYIEKHNLFSWKGKRTSYKKTRKSGFAKIEGHSKGKWTTCDNIFRLCPTADCKQLKYLLKDEGIPLEELEVFWQKRWM